MGLAALGDPKVYEKLNILSIHKDGLIKLNYRKEAWPIFNYHRHYDIKRIPELFNKFPDSKNISV